MADETTETTEETTTSEETEETTTEEKSSEEKGSTGEEKVTPDDDWRAKSRKNETRAKRAERERDELKKRLEKIEESNKSESEKAIEKAREEARSEALSEAEKERRSDRLEVAVTRLASKGLTIGEGDDAETKRFADTDDALLNIERAISKGEIDEGDIFDDEGKVDADALKSELADLLRRKPHLAAEGTERNPGDPDTRKGGPKKSDLESMTPEDHARRKYGEKK